MSGRSPSASRTGSLIRISPPSAFPAIRAAMTTLRPNRSSASDRRPHVDAHAHTNVVKAISLIFQRLLRIDTTAQGIAGFGEGEHESVPLGFDHMSAVLGDQCTDKLIVSTE